MRKIVMKNKTKNIVVGTKYKYYKIKKKTSGGHKNLENIKQ